MKLIKFIPVIPLCLLIGACNMGYLDIDIGDYDYHLEAWNSQNMLDYQIRLERCFGVPDTIKIKVEDGSTGKLNHLTWYHTTIPEIYSDIKIREKRIRDENKSGFSSYSLKVSYHTKYHYPNHIIEKINGRIRFEYFITLMPLEEGDMDIDIGDYENQLAAWNSQDMRDYQIEVRYSESNYSENYGVVTMSSTVRNGISTSNGSVLYPEIRTSIPAFYAFIKEEEERIRKAHDGKCHCYLYVLYDTEHHYPIQISSGGYNHFGRHDLLEITLMPLPEGGE